MRKIIGILLSAILLTSCGNPSEFETIDTSADLLVKKACDGESSLSWQQRANLIAQANAINGKWERLSDAANSQAGFFNIKKSIQDNPGTFQDARGEALSVNAEAQIMYAQFVAECSRL